MDWRQYELNEYTDKVKQWNLTSRIKFEDLDIRVGISDSENFIGPLMPVREEMSEFNLQVRDSYGDKTILPDYSALFYSLKEVSVTKGEKANGLSFGPIESIEAAQAKVF